jgi:hypothetical protein
MTNKPHGDHVGITRPEGEAGEPLAGNTVADLNWDDVAESILVARVLVEQYGTEAPLKAEASASRLLLDWADLDAWAYWKRAGKAAEQLLLTEPTGTIH